MPLPIIPIAIGFGALALLGGKKSTVAAPPSPHGGPEHVGPPPPGPYPGGKATPPYGHAPLAGPMSPDDITAAKALAPKIDADVRAHGDKYDKTQVEAFQNLCRIWVDGMYGPRTSGAATYFLGHTAAPPIYSDRYLSKSVKQFTPPTH